MKKIIALLACLALLLRMAACGTTTPEVTDPTDPISNVTDPTDPTDEITETPDEPATTEGTVGETLLATFKANSYATAQEIADLVISNPIIQFMPMTMPVNPVDFEYLSGLGEAKIDGYEECVMFGPMIGTIPFIGYVFTLAEDADV